MKHNDPEKELRALWTAKGVPEQKQDEMIADTTAKAQPGAWVGPFQIGRKPERQTELFPPEQMPWNLDRP